MVSTATERLTRNQLGALNAVDLHESLSAGWGGYSKATLLSLERRGFLTTSFTCDEFRLTNKGRAAITENDRRAHPEWFGES